MSLQEAGVAEGAEGVKVQDGEDIVGTSEIDKGEASKEGEVWNKPEVRAALSQLADERGSEPGERIEWTEEKVQALHSRWDKLEADM